MTQFSYTIQDETGIHARPAGALVKLARKMPCAVVMKKDGKTADLKKIFTLMALAVKCGDTVTVEVSGEGEKAAADKLSAYFRENL
ncbi:HPr family phosphocarrier protein [Congzhengia sp.]|uniref:HPr family phosphocarrier protein n=1 Tax=Congzhengia sp. TaxID=2944168 RepID=UPI000E7EE25E|nr:HPr family phosphocarrier protein [Clostridiales bacterium]HBL81315.1 HPr family phosphocarrier protein [Clostridiales bacterium]